MLSRKAFAGSRIAVAIAAFSIIAALGAAMLMVGAAKSAYGASTISSKTWSQVKGDIDDLVSQDIPYVYGGHTTSGFDCSGFVSYVMTNIYGLDIGCCGADTIASFCSQNEVLRGTTAQAYDEAVANGTVKPGDVIVCYSGSSEVHAALAYEDGQIVHTSSVRHPLGYQSFDEMWEWNHDDSGYYTSYRVYRALTSTSTYVRVERTSTRPALTDGNSRFSLTGGVYKVYSSSSCSSASLVGTITTNWRGVGKLVVDPGTYWVKQVKTSYGYNVCYDVCKVTATQGSVTTAYYDAEPVCGGVRVVTSDTQTGRKAQGDATFEGAVYTIYNATGCTITNTAGKQIKNGGKVGTITAGEDGIASTGATGLSYGTYKIKLTSAPEGYESTGWSETFTISKTGQVIGLNTPCKVQVVTGGVSVSWPSYDLDSSVSASSRTKKGGTYAIYNMSSGNVVVDGVAHAPGTIVKTITTSAKGGAWTTRDALPYGTYKIRQVKAPNGYLASSTWSKTFSTRAQDTWVSI